jgi:transposase
MRTIARVLRLSRRTVRKYLEPVAAPRGGGGGWEEKIDWEHVRQEVNGKGTTIKQIGREVASEIEYVKFWRAFRERVGPQGVAVTIRLAHKPGEKPQVDFCNGLFITDPVSGNKTLTQFFLGVLPFSSYTFGEFVLDQKLPTFIGVQERMFAHRWRSHPVPSGRQSKKRRSVRRSLRSRCQSDLLRLCQSHGLCRPASAAL